MKTHLKFLNESSVIINKTSSATTHGQFNDTINEYNNYIYYYSLENKIFKYHISTQKETKLFENLDYIPQAFYGAFGYIAVGTSRGDLHIYNETKKQ